MLAFVITLLVIILDFVTKYAVKTTMAVGESITVIPYVFNITYVLNRGAAWGIFSDKRWIFMIFSTIAIVVIAVCIEKFKSEGKLLTVALSMVLGGGIGNMIDRIFNGTTLFDGAVVDFFEAAFIEFPVFNVADCFVCIGTGLMLLYLIFSPSKKEEK